MVNIEARVLTTETLEQDFGRVLGFLVLRVWGSRFSGSHGLPNLKRLRRALGVLMRAAYSKDV